MGKQSGMAREAKRARQQEEARESMVKKGTAAIRASFDKQFNQGYYDKAFEDQKAVYQPEFDTQWERARKGLEAALMRSGLYDSTEGIQRMKDSLVEKDKRQTAMNARALSEVDARRQSVLAAQDNVIGQLRASGDLNAATASAAQQLAAQSRPIPFSPLGAVFTDFTAGLAEQAEQERQGTNRYNLGISNWVNPRRYTSNVG